MVGLALFVAIFYLFASYLGKKALSRNPGSQLGYSVTKCGYVFYSISILVILLIYSLKWLAPHTPIGKYVSTYKGIMVTGVFVAIVFGLIERALHLRGYATLKKNV